MLNTQKIIPETLKLDEILDLADTIENWNASPFSQSGFFNYDATITKKSPYRKLTIALCTNVTYFLNRFKSLDIGAFFEGEDHHSISLGFYSHITLPKAMQVYERVKEKSVARYMKKQEEEKLAALAYARSLLHKEK